VSVYDSFGEDAFRVRIDPAAKLDPRVAPPFTKKQGHYLAFIYNYSKIHGRALAEMNLQQYFQTPPPSVHQMIKTLELSGFIERTAGQARSIPLLVRPEHLPDARVVPPRFCAKCSDVTGYAPRRGLRVPLPQGA
jgi:hypothetical protein